MNLDEDERQMFIDNIRVYTEEPFLAVMEQNTNGGCSFLDEKGFCSIQLKHGYDYLSRTCRIHPRSISYIGNEVETFLELSCEESVRVVLFDRNLMRFEECVIEPDGSGNVYPNRVLTPEVYTSAPNALEMFWKLRMTSIAIVQYRNLSVRVRMLLLCLFIEQLSLLLNDGNDYKVPKFADEFSEAVITGKYNHLSEQMPDGMEIDFKIVLDILREIELKNDKRFNKFFNQSLEGLGIESGSNELPDSFREKYKKYYQQYLAKNEYIFENFLMNHLLMEGFPFNFKKKTGDVMQNYADLLAKHNLVEFLLVGICRYGNKFDRRSIINSVSSFSRAYDHTDKGYLMAE
jgi:lysine-N-methylase